MYKETDRSSKTGFVSGVLSLRGILAIMVATAHTLNFTILCNYSGSVLDQHSLRDMLAKACTVLHVPTIFFIISGLAIARSLDRKEEFTQRGRTYVIFIVRRALRLYPAHIAATFGILVLAWIFLMDAPPVDVSRFQVTGIDFLAGWLNGAVFNPLKTTSVIGNFLIATWSMNLVVWSLYVEVCAIPFLPLFHRIVRDRNAAADAVVLGCLVIISIRMWGTVGIQFLFTFYLGMLVQTRGRDCARFLIRCTGGAGRAALLAWAAMFGTGLVQPQDWQPAFYIQAVGAFAVICLVVWRDETAAPGLLSHPVLRWTGLMSYSFYLWHYIVLTVIVRQFYVALSPAAMLRNDLLIFAVVEIASVAVALGLAQLSYSYVEEPCILWGMRMEAVWRRLGVPRALQPTLRPAPQVGAEAAD